MSVGRYPSAAESRQAAEELGTDLAPVGLVYGQMTKVLAALDFIPKQRSQGVSYEFRGIDAVMNVLHGPLAEHGLFLSPRVLDDWQLNMIPGKDNRQQAQALFRVCVDVYAEDGSSVTLGPGLAQSHDYGDKAVYQAQQNAIKYLLLEAFCIPTAEQDMDARESDAVPTTPPVDLTAVRDAIARAKAAEVAVNEDEVLAFAANSQDHAVNAVKALEKKIAEAEVPF